MLSESYLVVFVGTRSWSATWSTTDNFVVCGKAAVWLQRRACRCTIYLVFGHDQGGYIRRGTMQAASLLTPAAGR